MTQSVYKRPKNIAIFASGTGTNAARIMEYFKLSNSIKIALIACNNPLAGVINVATSNNIDVMLLEKEKFFKGNGYVEELKSASIDFIVLAGFLWKIPEIVIKSYRNNIINIHPALLPKYGGKGMYGLKVHEVILAAGDKETGITVHYVDEHYDNGNVIFQAKCPVLPTDSPQTLAQRVHQLEYEHFPKVIEQILNH